MKKSRFFGWRFFLGLALVALLMLGGAGSALASEIMSGDSIRIGTGEVIDDDVIIFGNTIVVDGTVNGDLIVFGSDITLNGTVNGSAVLAGQHMNVSGKVTGTLYSGGSALELTPNAVIQRNVMFGGYSLRTEAGSIIARDVSVGGAQAVLGGSVGRDVQFGGQALELNGEVGRNVRAAVSETGQIQRFVSFDSTLPPSVASGLRVSKDAKVGGSLTYASPVEQSNGILAQPTGGVVYQATPSNTQNVLAPSPYEWLFTRMRDFFTVLILGGVALVLMPRVVKAAVANAQNKPLASTGWGLVVLIAGYVLAVVAFVVIVALGVVFGISTLGGLSVATFGVGLAGLGLGVTVFTGIVLWGAKVIVSYAIGKLLLQQFAPDYADNTLFAFVLGLVLFEIVAAIPILGTVVTLVAILWGLGALWYVYYERRSTPQVSMPKQAPMPA
jgi:cytoskeletal protein CcmA (bactofilin family)